jgi:uncharacterized protein DUF5753
VSELNWRRVRAGLSHDQLGGIWEIIFAVILPQPLSTVAKAGLRPGPLPIAGDIYLEERADVDRYTLAFDRLLAAALHPDDSVRMVQQAPGTMT